jgi:hypothetical protein
VRVEGPEGAPEGHRQGAAAARAADCEAELAVELDEVRADVDASLARCDDTQGLAGCFAADDADPGCLGDAAVSIGGGLVDAALGLEE